MRWNYKNSVKSMIRYSYDDDDDDGENDDEYDEY